MPLSLAEFVERWKAVTLTERAAAQLHFADLCEVLHQPHPAAADQTGESFTFEKPVSKLHGGEGFADVWKRGFFAWEYKGIYPHGKVNENTDPRPFWLVTSTCPPCASMMAFTMARPIPVPCTRKR